jgi:hypothetical protein
MGGAGSVLSPEQTAQLSEDSLLTFHRYHEECKEQELNDAEMYDVLAEKYKSLFEMEQEAKRRKRRKSKGTDSHGSPAVTKTPPPEPFQPDQAHLALMAHDHKEEESLSAELQLVMEELSDMDLGEFDQTYTQSLVKKVFNVDKYDRLHKKGRKGSLTPTDEATSHATEVATHGVFHCNICNICFDNKTVLDVHIEHSELHKKNIRERERRLEDAHNEAVRLTALAKNVMNALYMGLPVEQEHVDVTKFSPGSYEAVVAAIEAKDQHHREVRQKWKRGMDKILHRRLCEKFSDHLQTRINVPRGVELLYEGSKYFHRTKTTYDLRYLLHTGIDVVEIVPHYVPFNHDTSTLAESPTQVFLACKRIYLNYTELVKSFFGYNITHTELTDDLHIGEAPILLHEKGAFHDAEIQAMDIFVTNRLKLHKSHTADDALFFDLHGISHDTLIKELPKRLNPVPIEVEVIANIWRIHGEHQPPTPQNNDTGSGKDGGTPAATEAGP